VIATFYPEGANCASLIHKNKCGVIPSERAGAFEFRWRATSDLSLGV
jgi:hypothetical protein